MDDNLADPIAPVTPPRLHAGFLRTLGVQLGEDLGNPLAPDLPEEIRRLCDVLSARWGDD